MSIFTWLKQKTTDDFIAPIENLITDLENHVADRVKQLDEHNTLIDKYEEAKAAIETDIEKAEKFVNKIKDFFN